MDPVMMAGIGALVNMGTGAIFEWLAGSSSAEEKRQREQALAQYSALAPPAHRSLIAREVSRSRMADVRRNPAMEATQDEVMAGLMDVARDGESARGAAEYEQAALNSAQRARGDRMAAVAQADMQGLGPEAAYTDALLAGQADADRERMAGLQRAAYAEGARMEALGQAGSMAERRSATQWGQDAQAAQAQDELDIFNAGQWNEMQRYNDQSRYDAYDAELAKADRMVRGHEGMADMYQGRARRTREQGANIGGGINRAITAPGLYGPSGHQAAPAPTTAQSANPLTTPRPTSGAITPQVQEQQRQIQAGVPLVTPTRRRAR